MNVYFTPVTLVNGGEKIDGINFDMVVSSMCEYATCQKLASFRNVSSTTLKQVAKDFESAYIEKWLCPFDKISPSTFFQHGDIIFMGYDILVNF